MKRFQFHLQRLLEVKKHLERVAEQRQQQARAVLDSALAEVARVEEEIKSSSMELDAVRKSAALGSWQARYEQASNLGRALASARVRAQSAEQRWQEANVARVQISTEVEALQQLRRQQWQEHRDEEARRGQEHLDEIGMSRWLAVRDSSGAGNSPSREER